MKRYLEFQNGIAINELFTIGIPTPPVGRFMVDVTDRPDIILGWKVNEPSNIFTNIIDVKLLTFTAPIIITTQSLSTLEQTVNKIAVKLGIV